MIVSRIMNTSSNKSEPAEIPKLYVAKAAGIEIKIIPTP